MSNSCDPMDYSPPGSSVHGISQARILEWVASSFSGGSSQARDWTQVSCIGRQNFYHWVTKEAPFTPYIKINPRWTGLDSTFWPGWRAPSTQGRTARGGNAWLGFKPDRGMQGGVSTGPRSLELPECRQEEPVLPGARQACLCGFYPPFLKLPRQNVLEKYPYTNHNYAFYIFLALSGENPPLNI